MDPLLSADAFPDLPLSMADDAIDVAPICSSLSDLQVNTAAHQDTFRVLDQPWVSDDDDFCARFAPSCSDVQAKAAAQQDHEEPAKEIMHSMDVDTSEGHNELWGPGVDISVDEFHGYVEKLLYKSIDVDNVSTVMNYEEIDQINERLARYRIRFYKMFKAKSGDQLKDPMDYSPAELWKERYFVHYEEDESLGWYFHPDHIRLAALNDYQKLVLISDNYDYYERTDVYHSFFNTYEIDYDYVKYCEELSKKIKWIGDYVLLNRSSPEWKEMDNRAWFQAAKIAMDFRFMTLNLAHLAYTDYIMNLGEIEHLKNYGSLFFEIWKLVTKRKKKYIDALEEVYQTDKFHGLKPVMQADLMGGGGHFRLKRKNVPNNVEEDEALDLITREVFRKLPITMTMWRYVTKKIEIAEQIGLLQPHFCHLKIQDLKGLN